MGLFEIQTLEEECVRCIEARGAVLRTKETGNHYLLNRSGLHTDTFFRLARVFEHGPSRERLAKLMIERMREREVCFRDIEVLAGPAFGALPIMYTMQHFTELEHTRVIFTERNQEGQDVLGRGFSLHPDELVFIIDDVATTFQTIQETIVALNASCENEKERWDAHFIGCGVLINRSPETTDLLKQSPTLDIISGIRRPLTAYSRQECLYHYYCRKGVPLVRA